MVYEALAVTGGAGRLGKYICDEFLDRGHAVLSIDIAPPSGSQTGNADADGAGPRVEADFYD